MSMSKKHYEAIAATINAQLKTIYAASSDEESRMYRLGVNDTAYAMAEVFKRDNPRFDTDRFVNACMGR